jgi:hypothetical protein
MDNEKSESHPSFGMVGFSHCNSNGTILVGSEFRHHNFVTLTIRRAEKMRDLSREWWFGRAQLIEIHLSEAQFVELIGRPNMGDGVPCTLYQVAGELIDNPPEPIPESKKYRDDMKADASKCVEELTEAHSELVAAIESGKIGKTVLREIAKKIEYAGYAVSDGIPFVQKSFDEKMESTINHAAAEIEATVANLAMRRGIERIQEIAGSGPKLLESGMNDEGPALEVK